MSGHTSPPGSFRLSVSGIAGTLPASHREATQVEQRVAFTAAEFEAQAMPHLNDVFRTAARVLRDAARAEDVVQDVYLQAWKSFARFEQGTNCKAWLYKILFHSISHYRRKWFKLRLLSEEEEYLEENLTWTPSIPERLTDEEILAALDKLPSDFRNVVLLVDVEEFSYKEAAEILGVPIGTVMSRLSRGRRQLRDHLAHLARAWGIGRAAAKGTV